MTEEQKVNALHEEQLRRQQTIVSRERHRKTTERIRQKYNLPKK